MTFSWSKQSKMHCNEHRRRRARHVHRHDALALRLQQHQYRFWLLLLLVWIVMVVPPNNVLCEAVDWSISSGFRTNNNDNSNNAQPVDEANHAKILAARRFLQESPPPDEASGKDHYGVDVSFPMHHSKVSTNYLWLPHNQDPTIPVPSQYQDMVPQPLGNRQSFYDEFIQGCFQHYGSSKGRRCFETERDRIEMSLRQPQSMQNYTHMGFQKIRTPEHLWGMLQEFWQKNKNKGKPEQWGSANTYTNNWVSPSEMVSVEDSSLRGGGFQLKQALWDEARFVLSEWTGEELTQCSLYGIRVYKEGSILSTHVDRLPLVSSAIINVDQDLDEPWPLEVIGHDGRAYNVTMEPGDMVLYESHSVLHGRPFPLKGRFMANIFIHFEPVGHSLRHYDNLEQMKHDLGDTPDVHQQYRNAMERGIGGHEHQTGLPPYIIPHSPEDEHWRLTHPKGYNQPDRPKKQQKGTPGSSIAHAAAQAGELEMLKAEIVKDKNVVNAKDANGWTPLHEASRAGFHDAVKLLVENGADINAKTNGVGGTALWWAKHEHEPDHPVVLLLESMGALDAGPEL